MEPENDRERWRGRVESQIDTFTASIASVNARLDKLDARQQILELKVQTLATKIGLYASLGAFLGGGIMSIVVGVFLHKP